MARLQDGVTKLKKWLELVTLLEEGDSKHFFKKKIGNCLIFTRTGFFFRVFVVVACYGLPKLYRHSTVCELHLNKVD